MKLRSIKRIGATLTIVQLLTVFVLITGGVTAQAQRALKIVDYATGSASISLGNDTQPMPQGGYPLAVKVILDGATTGIAFWQVTITFDNNSLRCTNILVPETDPSYIFSGKQDVATNDFSNETQDAKFGGVPHVIAAAGLVFPLSQAVDVSNSAILCVMNFTARRTGSFNLSFVGVANYADTFLGDPNNTPLPQLGQPYEALPCSVSVTAAASKPVAVFTFSPKNPRANQVVTFDASSSYDPGGESIQTYRWDFGDNTTATLNATQQHLNHTYIANGLYLVNLTIANTDNVTGSTVLQLQVGSIPVALFTHSPAGVILPNDLVTFNASGSEAPNSTIISYTWDFGNNSTTVANTTVVTHTYPKRGVYNVSLTVTDNDGLFNSTVIELQVGKPPSSLFTWAPPSPFVGDAVTFTAQATPDTGVSITAYIWDFGEVAGPLNGSATMIHPYAAEANYIVTLTVYDSDGLHTSFNQTVPVAVVPTNQIKKVDYTLQVFGILVVVLLAAALVVRRLSRKREQVLEI
jgi:PKD repeat protein